MTLWGLLQSAAISLGSMVVTRNRRAKPIAGQRPANPILSLPQDSALAAPRFETESQPEPWPAKLPSQPTLLSFSDSFQIGAIATLRKVNCLTPKVNTFFGSLLINIFQKQDYLNKKDRPIYVHDHDQ
jgi:hypothetical protein